MVPPYYYHFELFGSVGRLRGTESGVAPYWFNLDNGEETKQDDVWKINTGFMVTRRSDSKQTCHAPKMGKQYGDWKNPQHKDAF